jgi:hypothetical protein
LYVAVLLLIVLAVTLIEPPGIAASFSMPPPVGAKLLLMVLVVTVTDRRRIGVRRIDNLDATCNRHGEAVAGQHHGELIRRCGSRRGAGHLV